MEVVEDNGKIIGYMCGGVSERLMYRKKNKYAELENMIIDENLRGKGIGKRLVKDFINWCRKNKVNFISVTAFAKNEPTLNFYRKLGFSDYNLTLEMKIK